MMEDDPETALLHHANKQFFAAVELASQKETKKAIEEFEKAITLYNLLSAKCSDDLKEWCSIAIDEASSQKLHLELNELDETPKQMSPEEKRASEEKPGAIFRVVCSLELVSCYLLSRDRPEELITDGSKDPIRLCISNEENRDSIATEAPKTEKGTSTPPAPDTSSSASTAASASTSSSPLPSPSETTPQSPVAFLQITPTLPYPLGPDVPCLRAQAGYFVFMLPDQKYYGIVFPEGYPEDALAAWENELAKYCALCGEDETDGQIKRILPTEGAEAMAVKVAQEGEAGAVAAPQQPGGPLHFMARGITTGAEYVTWGIRSTSDFLRSGIERTGGAISQQIYRPDAKAQVPAPLEASVGFVKNITPGVVYVSGGAASALASLAGYIGSAVGSILPTNTGGGPGHFGFRAVGVASVKAAWDVWSELAGVGQNLIDGTQKASVQVVKARYGDNAGKFTNDLIGIGSDIYKVNKNIHSFGIKSLAKGSIKAAGTAVVKSHIDKENSKSITTGSKTENSEKTKMIETAPTPSSSSSQLAKISKGETTTPKTSVLIEPAPSHPSGTLKRDTVPPKPATKLISDTPQSHQS